MEIQDKNSLLQFSLNLFDGLKVKENKGDNADFAKMIKPEDTKFEVKQSFDFEAKKPLKAKEKPAPKEKTSFKEKEDTEIKEKPKTKDKKTTRSQDDTPVSSSENQAPAEKPEAKTSNDETSSNEVTANNEVTTAENTVETNGSAETSSMVNIAVMPNMADANVIIKAQTTALNDTVIPSALLNKANTDMPDIAPINEPDTSLELNSSDTALSEEEALLLKQAKLLDEKVASNSKLNINVEVKEVKIADTMPKDVLQNSFEIKSMLQEVKTQSLDNASVVNLSTEDVKVTEDASPVIFQNVQTQNIDNDMQASAVVYNEVMMTGEDQAKTVHNDMNIAIVGKDNISANSDISRNEMFAKINDAKIRDDFKGLSKEVVEQVKVNITKSAVKGVDTIDVQLQPEELGKIQIKMHISKDGKLQADIISNRPDTVAVLQRESSELVKAFNSAGYNADSSSFNFSFQGENQQGSQQTNDNANRLSFIGDKLEQEAENSAQNDNLEYNPAIGLNIRV